MKPSRIVKSVHKRAGSTLTVKAFARHVVNGTIAASTRVRLACSTWLANKRAGKSTTDAKFGPANGRGPTPEQKAVQ